MSYHCKSNDEGGFGTELSGISKNSSIPGKNNGFFRRSLFHFTHWNSFLHSVHLLSLPIYVWQPRYWPQCRQIVELSGRLS